MKSIRTRLIVAFLAATVIPLVVTLYIMTSLLERSLSYAPTDEIEKLSKALEETGREFYQQARDSLREDARAGATKHETFAAANRAQWPAAVADFADSAEMERFAPSETGGDRLNYFVRHGTDIWLYTETLGNVRMEMLTQQIRHSRGLVEEARARDLRRGFNITLLLLVAAVWLVSFVWLIYLANRMTHPIRQLTAGLSDVASGNLETRIQIQRSDEIGHAIDAFNYTAGQLQQNRERLIYLTQMASWQLLARKMAHELKNSLTPIRLTVEEILARQPAGSDRAFIAEAVQIVVAEVESLERRVRAFSDFSAEPQNRPASLDIPAILEERVSFLRSGHPEITYVIDAAKGLPLAKADPDRVRGILTNLLENAADAAGAGGRILGCSYLSEGQIHVEIHDSGAGLSEEARKTLFEPTISFKRNGTGLGLSIARKDALVCGGDLLLVAGKLSGAGFRLILPAIQETTA